MVPGRLVPQGERNGSQASYSGQNGCGGGFSSCVWLSEQPIAPVRTAASPRWHRLAPYAHEASNCPRLSVQTAAGKHSAATNHAAADTNVLGAPRVPRLTSEHRTAPASTADGQTRCAESGPPMYLLAQVAHAPRRPARQFARPAAHTTCLWDSTLLQYLLLQAAHMPRRPARRSCGPGRAQNSLPEALSSTAGWQFHRVIERRSTRSHMPLSAPHGRRAQISHQNEGRGSKL